MSKASIVKKLEAIVASLREQVEKNDGSTLAAISAGAKFGLDAVSSYINTNETAQSTITKAKRQLTALEKAVREGDKKVSAKALDFLETAVEDLKSKSASVEKDAKDAKGAKVKSSGKAAAAEKPAKSASRTTAKKSQDGESASKPATARKAAPAKKTAGKTEAKRNPSSKTADKGDANTPAAKKTAAPKKRTTKNSGSTAGKSRAGFM